ncbi:MAG: PaaI family thioesterase [Dehalococcoidia bacterium]
MSTSEKKPADLVDELKARAGSEAIASFLNMNLLELSPGYARVSMKVISEYQNFNGMTFGGIIMSVADQAFAYASNSLSFPSVASQFNLHFISGANAGDELIAECRVIKSGKRVGLSEMTVSNQDGKLIARATGTTIPTG